MNEQPIRVPELTSWPHHLRTEHTLTAPSQIFPQVPTGTEKTTRSAPETAPITGRTSAAERPTSDLAPTVAPVLAAVWCRSVGTSWTLELHQLNGASTTGRIVDWIISGMPITQPQPDALARHLLAQRGLHLFRDPSAGPGTHSRHGIGYVCTNAQLITLAHLVRDDATETGVHPVVLAAQWIAAGFSADVAARWIRQGIESPQTAQHQTPPTERIVSPTHPSISSRPPSQLRNRTCGLRGVAAQRGTRCRCRPGR
jgi:hypothetical protein